MIVACIVGAAIGALPPSLIVFGLWRGWIVRRSDDCRSAVRQSAMTLADDLVRFADDPAAMRRARQAIEDTLYDLRQNGLSVLGHTTGLVIAQANGERSSVVRLTIEDAVAIALRTLAREVQAP